MDHRLRALRLAFGCGERLAPGRTAVVAGNQWFTPPRPRRGTPTEPPGGQAFSVQVGEGMIRGNAWGGSGPRIYFMHGWGGRGADAYAQVPTLLEHGYRVVTFDGPAHGKSDALTAGTRRTNAVQFGQALGAVVALHGPAYGVVAHSLGAVAVTLSLRSHSLACERLVLLAPVIEVRRQLAAFCRYLNIGRRTRSHLDAEVRRHTGLSIDEFSLADPGPWVGANQVLVVHDRADSLSPYRATAAHVRGWPTATLVTTEGLGHFRLLRDASVARAVTEHLASRLHVSQ